MSKQTFRRVSMALAGLALLAQLLFIPAPAAQAISGVLWWVNHDANITPAAPTRADTVRFQAEVGYAGGADHVWLYYTSDGSVPQIDPYSGAPAAAGTTVVAMSRSMLNRRLGDLDGDGTDEWAALYYAYVDMSALPASSQVFRYRIVANNDTMLVPMLYADNTYGEGGEGLFPITRQEKARTFGFSLESNELPPWLDRAVIYRVMIDRFWDGGTYNRYCERDDVYSLRCDHDNRPISPPPDQPQQDYRYTYNGGDLRGIIEKLDYLDGLGINTLWLSPLFDNQNFYVTANYDDPRSDEYQDIFFAYDGRHVRNPYTYDEAFARSGDVETLLAAADARGMRVILDLQPNHVSNQLSAFAQASSTCTGPYYDWFTFSDCVAGGNRSFTVSFPPGFRPSSSSYTTYGANDVYRSVDGMAQLPQIDNDYAPARAWNLDIAQTWLNRYPGLAGYGVADAQGPSTDFWREFNDTVDASFTVADISTSRETVRRYAGQFDAALDYETQQSLRDFFIDEGPVSELDAALAEQAGYFYGDSAGLAPDQFVRACFLDGPDTDRFAHHVYTTWPGDVIDVCYGGQVDLDRPYHEMKMMNAALLQFTQPCVPVINYGDEVGLGQETGITTFDPVGLPEYARERIPWAPDRSAWGGAPDPIPPEWEWYGRQNMALRNFYTNLIRVRRAYTALRAFGPESTSPLYVSDADRAYAYLRTNGTNHVVVAFHDSLEWEWVTRPNGYGSCTDAVLANAPTVSIPDTAHVAGFPFENGDRLYDVLARRTVCTVSGGRCAVDFSRTSYPGVILVRVSPRNSLLESIAGNLGGQGLKSLLLFRDKVMIQTEAGQQLLDHYYVHSPELIEALVNKPQLATQIWDVVTWLGPALERHVNGVQDGQDIFTNERLLQVQELLDTLLAALDPTPEPSFPNPLAELIQGYYQQFPLQQYAGQPLDSVVSAAVQQFILQAPNGN